jgi:predicted short-subunit dehydrogenase-like oxidoreductase (DUF2520 family)
MATKSPRHTARKQSSHQPTISIVGPGRLGSSLSLALHSAGYNVAEIVTRRPAAFRGLARRVDARAVSIEMASLDSDIVWLTVGDSAIRSVADALAARHSHWTNQIAFHSSGALTSNELAVLSSHGASVASVHPLMTFSGRREPPSLAGVFVALEGDTKAVRQAKRIVKSLDGVPVEMRPKHKAAYHAWASFGSPLLVSLLAIAERVAHLAGINDRQARHALAPLIRQTLDNYVADGAPSAFTGALVRGDVETIRKHLEAVSSDTAIRDVYLALANAAVKFLPVQNRTALADLLKPSPRNPRRLWYE